MSMECSVIYIAPPSSRFTDHSGKESKKAVKARGERTPEKISVIGT